LATAFHAGLGFSRLKLGKPAESTPHEEYDGGGEKDFDQAEAEEHGCF